MRYLYLLFSFAFIQTNKAQNLYFPPTTSNTWDTLSPQTLGWCPERIDSLYAFLESQNTKAFIALKDGKIVLERYFGTFTQSDPWYWASAGKTLTAFMVGIAQQEGHLSIHDTTSNYLGQGWTVCTPPQEEKITIRHQLTMTSGLDDGVPDYHCTLDTCLIYKADAGTRWAYHNAPYTLLDTVIEQATGQTLNAYTTQKLKTPTGMTGSFFPSGYNNVFVSTARSMARYGLLILNRGVWDGTPIMTDTAYFNQMVNTSQSLNESYGYLWWLNGKPSFMVPSSQFVFPGPMAPNAPADMFAAMGKNGQFLNIVPSQNLVWLRMGDAPDDSDVPFLLNDQIWTYVNALTCTPTASSAPQRHPAAQLYPNPARQNLRLQLPTAPAIADCYNLQGQLVAQFQLTEITSEISIESLFSSPYVLRLRYETGASETLIFVKE